ncbi:MAG: M20 family metallo-hydrolase [Deltaproteobacteria bacterium]|nr:M20 family metallo-hydrolase [Deltaproteobacteria bacterium]
MSELENVFERIDGLRDEVIKLEGELSSRVALGPDNGGSGEHEKAAFTKGLLKELDPDVIQEIKAPDERAQDGYRPNLIASWGSTKTEPTVWVLSHSDIVPPGDPALWESDPYQLKVDGDRVIGRGVEDNQHGFVSPYLALKAVLESGGKLKMPVGLAVVADEETGSDYGLSYVLERHRDLFKEQDLIIVPDGGNEEGTMIEVAEKSMLWIKFTVTGKQCHASTPNKGKNSLFGAAKLIVALEKLKEKFDIADELFKPPLSTFEPTKMEANVPNINTIPGRDVFCVDCRVLPKYGVDEILDAAKEIAAGIGTELDLQIDVEPVYRQDATRPTPPDAPVVKALAGAIKRVTGKEAKPMGIGGGTVAAFFRRAGLPAAVWCTVSDTAHQPNEYCLISNILTDAKIFACLYLDEY